MSGPGQSNPQPMENITAMPQPVVDGSAPDMYFQPRSAPVTFAETPTVTMPPPPRRSFSTESQASYSHQIRFNHESPFSTFLNHSNYCVTYNNTVYPTATHLFEALKFLPGQPELAESIRQTGITQVYTASADLAQRYGASEDWDDRFQSNMDMVLELKFSEHPNLRMQLLGTGDAELVYDDPLDEYWGGGANDNGSNQFGKALMRVRQYLKDNVDAVQIQPTYTATSVAPVTIPPPPRRSFSTESQASYSHQIGFNQEGPFPAFLNHSNHCVTYNNTVYPTATHLYEALKFLPGEPELAEIIRQTGITQVYTASADLAQRYGASEDRNDRFQSDMDMVLELKFSEHPNLRMQLLGTGDAELVYDDPQDKYWGSGANGNGSNQLGKALMRVRQYLKDNSIPR